MNNVYVVKYNRWDLGTVALKKGDEVTITKIVSSFVVEINSNYFANPIRVEICDLLVNCEAKK